MFSVPQLSFLLSSLILCNAQAAAQNTLGGSLGCSGSISGSLAAPYGHTYSCDSAPARTANGLSAEDSESVYGNNDDLGQYAYSQASVSMAAAYGKLQTHSATLNRMSAGAIVAESRSESRATFSDDFVVSSKTLSLGTQVSLVLRYELGFANIWSMYSTGQGTGKFRYDMTSGIALLSGRGTLVNQSFNNSLQSDFGIIGYPIYYPNTTFIEDNPYALDLIYTQNVTTFVGETLSLSANLRTLAITNSSLRYGVGATYLGYSESRAGEPDGVRVSLTSATLDVELFSASGHNYEYVSSVPEPATLTLLAAGLFTFSVLRRANRRDVRALAR